MERKGTFRVPEGLLRAARTQGIEVDVSLSQAIRELLKLWVAGKIELPAKEEHKEE